MEPSVIDTLRFASRLKAAGVETRQAEAMSRALNDEIGSGVATKSDLDHAVGELKVEIAKVDARVDVMEARFDAIDEKFVAVDARFDGVDAKFDAKFDGMDAKFDAMDAKFDGMDAKFDAMDAKFNTLAGRFDTQGRYVFLVLALIAALGLFNAVYPQLTSKEPPSANVQPPRAASVAPVTNSEAEAR